MSYKVAPVQLSDAREDILSTWRAGFPEHTGERLDWMYRDNPAGAASVWIARDDDTQQAVGSTALVRRVFVSGGSRLTGGISADFTVLTEHRGFGPALALQRQAASAADAGQVSFVYGTPNKQAAPLVRRAGYKTIGCVSQLTRPLRTKYAIERKVGSGFLASILAPIADLGLSIVSATRLADRGRHYAGEAVPGFDSRFDVLWQRVVLARPLIGERSAEFLAWRFSRASGTAFEIFAVADRRTSELGGYVVFSTSRGRTDIADILARDDDALRALIARFVAARRKAGDEAISVNFFGDPAMIRALKRHGFSVRDCSDPVMVYVPPGTAKADAILTADNWWMFRADNDV
jgi:hypothetical protein